jgi:hypothetical protein
MDATLETTFDSALNSTSHSAANSALPTPLNTSMASGHGDVDGNGSLSDPLAGFSLHQLAGSDVEDASMLAADVRAFGGNDGTRASGLTASMVGKTEVA